MPEEETATIDFSPLFQAGGARLSNSVYLTKDARGLLDRVLLAPGLVFESSRSSVAEPATVGPRSESAPGAPNLSDALGTPVDVALSSALLRYLSAKGSTLVAPAITRVWLDDHQGPPATWVERLLLMARDEAARGSSSPLPTCVLAVRSLGISWRSVAIVVKRTGERSFEVRVRRGATETTDVPELAEFQLPTIWLQAELLAVPDGRLLARIDERWVADMREVAETARLTHTVLARRYSPSTQRWTDPATRRVVTYTAGWVPEDVFARNVVPVYRQVRESVEGHFTSEGLTDRLFSEALDPLYAD